MHKDEMRAGLLQGRTLIQEERSTPEEIAAVDELIAEGIATATPWAHHDYYQCEFRRISARKTETAHA